VPAAVGSAMASESSTLSIFENKRVPFATMTKSALPNLVAVDVNLIAVCNKMDPIDLLV
jgi:hypothetical protein